MIAQKLTNDEYDNIDSLNQEIHGFLDYFHEEGPKGPNSFIVIYSILGIPGKSES